MRTILSIIFGVFVIMFIGSILLTEFPELQPIFNEGKEWVASIYNMSVVKYGAAATGMVVLGLFVLLGDKKR